jgi:hypothetical protein
MTPCRDCGKPKDRRATRCRLCAPIAQRRPFWSFVDQSGDCWLWTGVRRRSHPTYGGAYGFVKRDGRYARAHRVAYELTYGPIPDGMEVAHRCDNPPCVRPEHLFLATHAENMADMARKGRGTVGDRSWTRLTPERIKRGEASNLSRLTESDVRTIRERRAAGESARSLAVAFGIYWRQVYRITNRENWSHVA